MPSPTIRPATDRDGAAIAAIYNHYIASTVVTFEELAVDATEMAARIAKVQAAHLPWLVAEEDGEVVGYAYAAPWHVRAAYRYSVEVSVYLDHQATGRGLGSLLYEALFPILKSKKIHVAIGGLTLPNPASEALHQKFGMQKVAHYHEVGRKFGQWLDVGYWQTTLDDSTS
ncbi:GNAT family N-acetyltransferase [Pelagicoccus enzymogenes]|uniref:arsinothricin resistance N-acetyltransferase ArsN1 family B n=1 Tax=Pelagicoccus enzymogenes TaxID=2773457 RepID=UPI00280ECE42|nr:arsinothricin resistance N-acetyltransferase ArsN1 family B [Pelagicoccus enzymogenes]MDQ8199880.1 GNAT family N-acetyltransferase [Pelagicoccus enzymogenes]